MSVNSDNSDGAFTDVPSVAASAASSESASSDPASSRSGSFRSDDGSDRDSTISGITASSNRTGSSNGTDPSNRTGSTNMSSLRGNAEAEQYGVPIDSVDEFKTMNREVFLAAQMIRLASGDGESAIKAVFGKTAKYYYGLQVNGSDSKRMYNKRSKTVNTKRGNNAAAKKELGPPDTGVDDAAIAELRARIPEQITMFSTDPAVYARGETDGLFTTLEISNEDDYLKGGARVLIMAKCKTETDGTVSAFGKLLFIKSAELGKETSFVIKLDIKSNKVMLGHGGDEGTVLNELLKSLFGTTSNFEFVTADKAAVAAEAQAVAQNAVDGATMSDEDRAAAIRAAERAMGGKSTRRKRKNSRKKGSTKKPVSHKKRKSGASKKRRSHPKKK